MSSLQPWWYLASCAFVWNNCETLGAGRPDRSFTDSRRTGQGWEFMLLELIVVGALAGAIMKRAKKKRLRRFLKPNVPAMSGASLRTQSHSVADNTSTLPS